MNKNIGIIIGVITLIPIVGGLYLSMNDKDDAMMTKRQIEQKTLVDQKIADEKAMLEKKGMEEKDTVTKADDTKTASAVKKDELSMMDQGDVILKEGSYEAYAPEKLTRAETGDVILFFHASWCPSCRGLNSSIESNIKSIPKGVTILKTDYDKETELKKKYGVTYQHTLVQVDKSGNMIKKWSGSGTLDGLLSQIQ